MTYRELGDGKKFRITKLDGKISHDPGIYEKVTDRCFIKHVPSLGVFKPTFLVLFDMEVEEVNE